MRLEWQNIFIYELRCFKQSVVVFLELLLIWHVRMKRNIARPLNLWNWRKKEDRNFVFISSELPFKEGISIPDSQRYHLNLNLINYVEDIIVFLRLKVLSSNNFCHCFEGEILMPLSRETTIYNNQFSNSKLLISNSFFWRQPFLENHCRYMRVPWS